jgi:HAMP domain-containing protein
VTVRTLGLLSLVAALAVGGWLFSQQAKTTGPTSELAELAQADAIAGVAGINFQAAATELQAWHAANGTYEGATLSPGFNVLLRRADPTSYCLQAGSGTTVQHVNGPGGTPQPGPCV